MGKPRKGWREKDANDHWNNHTDDKSKSFFKVLIRDFRKRLVLPDKFALHFRGKIARSIKLESRSGHTFDVQVAKNSGRLVLQSGWESFVSAHGLKMLDFLVFEYDEISRMKVLIFDHSGCEKVPTCSVTKNAINGRQRKEESFDISGNYAKTANISSSSCCPSESSGGSASSEEHEAHSVPRYILPRGTNLTNVQNKKLEEKVQAICSEIPIYGCVMKKTNISGECQNMRFSGEYSEAYLRFRKRTLVLHRHGKSWDVMCHLQVPRGQCKFQVLYKGWRRFARDNNLRVGDLCLFELLETKKYAMKLKKEHGIKTTKARDLLTGACHVAAIQCDYARIQRVRWCGALYGRRAFTIPRAAAGAGLPALGSPSGGRPRVRRPPHHLALPALVWRGPSASGSLPAAFRLRRLQYLLSVRVWLSGVRGGLGALTGVVPYSNMRRPGKGCKERDTYYFWNDYTDDQDKHFFKVLVGDFHKRLVLPDKLALHFKGKKARSINLESPSGHTFDVQVAKNSGRLALQSGWESFVSAHGLKMMDFLVFKYDGISRMKVLIFDPTGCEKLPPCFVMKDAISGRKMKEESIDISSNYANLPMKTPEAKTKSRKQRNASKIANISSSCSPSESSGGSTSSEEHESRSVPSYILPRRTSLTNVQKKQLKENVGAICSEIPIFVCVMKKSNVSTIHQSMRFSGAYSEAYLPFKERTLMLHRHGKSWEVMCRIQVRRGHRNFQNLCKGWKRFARDNNLRLGDLCLFELLKTKEYTMNVHIISVVKMRKPGKRCKETDAHYYWNRSDEHDRYFFKVLAGDFRERLECLCNLNISFLTSWKLNIAKHLLGIKRINHLDVGIPDKFVQHIRWRIAKTVTLESRTGCNFDVEVTESLGKVVLQTGWKAFVCAHDLKMWDFLVFKYDGTPRLKVLIFDLSCCEKVPPCHIRDRGKGGEQIENSRSCDDFPMKSPGSKRKAWKQREGRGSMSPEDQKSHFVPSYILPRRTYLTCEQKKKLKEKVRAICSKTPIYGCVMKKTSIEGNPQTMLCFSFIREQATSSETDEQNISREYADEYLPFDDQTLLLQHRGESWEVRCHILKSKSNLPTKRLLKGWKQFARDNNLQVGDLCLFELLESREYTMSVHIIGAK
ncbi:hypothetical protein C2845_PM01G34770 [Panicum miliaceum]|uniref:TF-B3 domain-containing protein n=1 Tax=Panicum miliaceum TaxID=4540 RepID=A0A3L6TN32_PANMI|nr:hypothetical protein C2845_PM01G34770 [Panicum miliaceum]